MLAFRRSRVNLMRENTERWMELCAQAAIETDPAKLLKLVEEINLLLEQKSNRLKGPRDSKPDP
jgi:hypothetical protein